MIDNAAYLLSRGYKARLLGLLLAVSALNFTDRILVPVLAQPLKQELQLSDFQLGLLTGLGFAVVYTSLGIPVAWLADRFNRVRIIAAAVVIWSTMTAATGFATTFVHLLIARAGVGVGEAGFLPPAASLLSDHFAPNRRGSAMSIVQLGSPASTILGAVLAAWIASHWGWRTAFIAVGLPGIAVGVLVLLLLREPPRGLVEGQVVPVEKPPLRRVLSVILAKRSFRHLMAGGALAMFGLSSVGGFMTVYFMRVHGLPLAQAGATFGVIQFVAAVAGLLAGGFGSDRIAAGDARWRAWGPAVCLAIAGPCYLIGFSSGSLMVSAGAILVAGVFFFFFYVPTLTITQNLVGPESRATAIAVYSLAASILGSGFGPALTGLASDLFAQSAFPLGNFAASCPGGIAPAGAQGAVASACAAAGAYGVRSALLIVACLYGWAAFHFWMVGRTLREESHQPSA
jgi:MFS family permease